MKTLLSCLALVLILALVLPGCAVRNVPVVMEYQGLRLDEDVYEYWVACYRAQFAYDETEENRARLAEMTDVNIMKTLVAAALFDRFGLQLDTAARDIINAAMDKLVENAGGTREQLDEAAAAYGIDYEGLRIAITMERKAQALYNAMYGPNGSRTITDEEYELFYQASYVRVKMIYVSYVDFLTDEDGNRVWDTQAGRYQYVEKTGDELAKQQKKAEVVRQQMLSGLSESVFDGIATANNEDPAAKEYPNGYYFSRELDYKDYIPEVTAAAMQLVPNTATEVRSDYGVHFLYALPCDEGAWSEEANADFFDGFEERVGRYLYEEEINKHLTAVTVYHEVKIKTRYEDVEPNFDIYW
jgi:hypothetical protein